MNLSCQIFFVFKREDSNSLTETFHHRTPRVGWVHEAQKLNQINLSTYKNKCLMLPKNKFLDNIMFFSKKLTNFILVWNEAKKSTYLHNYLLYLAFVLHSSNSFYMIIVSYFLILWESHNMSNIGQFLDLATYRTVNMMGFKLLYFFL